MIKYLAIVLFLFACDARPSEEIACGAKFSDAIMNYKDGRKPFVILQVLLNGKTEKICLTNLSLYLLLRKKFNVEGNAYVSLVKRLLNQTEQLELTSNEITDNQIVVPDIKIKELYSAGLDTLIHTYFVSGVQNERAIENKNYMASVLFENCIVSWIDDETGYMVLLREGSRQK